MILCPLQNTAFFDIRWLQARPVVTQHFGLHPLKYAQYGMKGHNGTDYRAPVGTPVFAPIEGKAEVLNFGRSGLGLHIQIKNDRLMVILAHLSEVLIKTGDTLKLGDKIGLTGNTGDSTGPHLHMSLYQMANNKIKNSNNGFGGAFDSFANTINWKGAGETFTL